MIVYHTGFSEIRNPDVHYGRKNADFGQGFYMTDDREFSFRWARERKGSDTFVNQYDLTLDGLNVRTLDRDLAWFEYIMDNRAGKRDAFPEADIILGPIANDTIYNTFGILSSGLLSREQMRVVLMLGPAYRQIVLKTEKAAGNLIWRSATVVSKEDIFRYRETVKTEETEYQKAFAKILNH